MLDFLLTKKFITLCMKDFKYYNTDCLLLFLSSYFALSNNNCLKD
nr:MAG TPA: hypothetical protein [Bacteriophage sp.]